MTQRLKPVIISFDGLSIADYEVLQSLMPALKEARSKLDLHQFNQGFLCSPQAVWAEILTGQPWFKNGCTGYAVPQDSLGKLKVFSEPDLAVPPSLVGSDDDSNVVIINVPLLRPSGGRLWLADGSLPTNKVVSPDSLSSQDLFSSYKPRPAANIAVYDSTAAELAAKCIKLEAHRLKCATKLLQNHDWSKFVYRLTLFDQLSHVLGLDFLESSDLKPYDRLREFLGELNAFLEILFARKDVFVSILSAYSHVPCSDVVNLNFLLSTGGFAKFDPTEQSAVQNDARYMFYKRKSKWNPPSSLMSSLENKLVCSASVAASPLANCIYINSNDRFRDGCVADSDVRKTQATVLEFVSSALRTRLRQSAKLIESPIAPALPPVPNALVYVEGVEFHNVMGGAGLPGFNRPRTTHSHNGFAVSSRGTFRGDVLKLSEMKDVVGESVACR